VEINEAIEPAMEEGNLNFYKLLQIKLITEIANVEQNVPNIMPDGEAEEGKTKNSIKKYYK
jgi:hypothetical protein